jgi:hypothetical protein
VALHFPALQHSLGAAAPAGLDSRFPAISGIANLVNNAYLGVGMLAVVAGFLCYAGLRRTAARAAIVVVAALLMVSGVTVASFARSAVVELVLLCVLWWGVSKLVRFNMLGYFLLLATMTAAQSAAELLTQPNSFFRANGTVVCIAGVLLLAWPLVAWRRAASRGVDRGATA